MEENAYFLALFSGFFHLAAAFPLLLGLFQLGRLIALIPTHIGHEITGALSAWSDRVLGSLEILTIGTLWIAFSPPSLYRSRVRGAEMLDAGGED